MTYEPKNAYRTRTCRTERYLKDVVLLKNNSSRMRVRVCARGGSNSSGPAGRVMAPAHLRCAEATGGLVDGAMPRNRAPQGGRMAPRGYAPLGIGLGRFLTCGRIHLVRRPVAGPMCSAGYGVRSAWADRSPTGPAPTASPLRPLDAGASTSSSRGTACGSRRPKKPAIRKGRGPRSGRITGAGGAQRPQAGLLRLRQGLGTSGAEKAAPGPFNRVGRKSGDSTRRRPGRAGRGGERLAVRPDGRAGPGRCGWPAWRPRPKVRVSGTDAPAR